MTSSSSTIRMRPRGSRFSGLGVTVCRQGGQAHRAASVPCFEQARAKRSGPSADLDGRAATDCRPAARPRRRQPGQTCAIPIGHSGHCRGQGGFPGKPDRERRALARLGAKGERSRELLEDLPADEQAQPGAVRLGGEERLEQPAAVGQRDPPAVVLDGQHQPAVFDPRLARGSVPWSSVASIAFRTRFRTTCVR